MWFCYTIELMLYKHDICISIFFLLFVQYILGVRVRIMGFNATFNNISVIA